MEIVDMRTFSKTQRQQAAQLLIDSFIEIAPGSWNTLEEACDEIDTMLADRKIALAACDERRVLGIIGGQPFYSDVWELHPLAVAPSVQRKGVGTALVRALEPLVKARGAITLYLGTDDEVGWTSLHGVDLYPDPLVHLEKLRDTGGHPFRFYERLGFSIVGVVPDANGYGKPDILMAKRL